MGLASKYGPMHAHCGNFGFKNRCSVAEKMQSMVVGPHCGRPYVHLLCPLAFPDLCHLPGKTWPSDSCCVSVLAPFGLTFLCFFNEISHMSTAGLFHEMEVVCSGNLLQFSWAWTRTLVYLIKNLIFCLPQVLWLGQGQALVKTATHARKTGSLTQPLCIYVRLIGPSRQRKPYKSRRRWTDGHTVCCREIYRVFWKSPFSGIYYQGNDRRHLWLSLLSMVSNSGL